MKRQITVTMQDVKSDGKVFGKPVSMTYTFEMEVLQDVLTLHGKNFVEDMILDKVTEFVRNKSMKQFGDL